MASTTSIFDIDFPGLQDPSIPSRFTVFYRTHPTFGLEAPEAPVRLKDFQIVGTIRARDLEDVFVRMQGDNWSPEGEANNLLHEKGLMHTSMSVGDLVFDLQANTWHLVAGIGFRQVDPAL